MAERRIPSYPPVGSEERLDRIIDRGRSLRRRRQLGVGAGAGGAVAAVALAVVLVVGGGDDDGTEGVVADAPQDSSTSTTSTTAPPEPEPEGMVVTVVAAEDGERIVVEDPAQPGGELSMQCVQVTLRPDGAADGAAAVAEGYACDDVPAGDGGVPVLLLPTDGVEIGCAAVLSSQPPTTAAPTSVTTTFSLDASSVPPGDYVLEVGATSGIGDGCAGTDDDRPGGTENSATTTATLSVG